MLGLGGLVNTAMLEYYSRTITNIFDNNGGKLLRLYSNYTLGQWFCSKFSGDAIQTTAANQPAVQTSTGGYSYPDFDGAAGANYDALSAGPLLAAPTYNASINYIVGFGMRADTFPDGSVASIIMINSDGGTNNDCVFIGSTFGTGKLQAGISNARTNLTVVDGVWYRIILVKDKTETITIYQNGVAATNTGSSTMGTNWSGFGPTFGTTPVVTTRRYDGGLIGMFFAYSHFDFTSTDISDIDTALATLIG